MELSSFETNQIQSYLDAVGERLLGTEHDETLAGIESHIYDAVEARRAGGEEGNLVAAVLAELDAPEKYGERPAAVAAGGPRMSKLVIAGACLPAAALMPMLIGLNLDRDYHAAKAILVALATGLMLLGIILSKVALQLIKRSDGMLTGAGLALTFYLLPLLGAVSLIVSSFFFGKVLPDGPGAERTAAINLGIMGVCVLGSIAYAWYEVRSTRRAIYTHN